MEQTQTAPTGLKKGLYLIPAGLTAANIGMGFLAILYSIIAVKQATSGNPSGATENFDFAAKAIGLAILFDTLDGRIARMTGTSTEIGVQLDSLADVLTFGIAPVVLVYAWGFEFIRPEHNTLTNVSILILFMYLLCGTFRLARFNLQSSKSAEILTSKSKKDFVGLPIPAAAGVIAAMIHFHPERMKGRTDSEDLLIAWSLVALIGLLGFLMVSRIRYSSFKSVGTGRLPTYPVLLIAGIGMSIWLYSQWVLLLFAAGYLLYGLVGAIIRNTVLRNRQAASA